MKASKDRTEQFMHTASSSAVPPPPNSTSAPTSWGCFALTRRADSLLFAQQAPRGGPGTGFAPGAAGGGAAGADRKGKGRAEADGSADFLALDIDGDRGESGMAGPGAGAGSDGYQQMQLVEQQASLPPPPGARGVSSHRAQDNYIQSRSTAIESIESTIAELGQIFSQLAGMVAEQRETVQRIDADTTDIAA